jgi:hypothetical protein
MRRQHSDPTADQHGAVAIHRLANVPHDDPGLVIRAVREDRLADVEVTACGDTVEITPASDLAAVSQPGPTDLGGRLLHDVREVEDHTARARVDGENLGQQGSRPATHVHDPIETVEVVGVRRWRGMSCAPRQTWRR